jgi:NAD(P)-dependent dehydrogenase (short-subunit alcohol dehydrogenase family)
MWHNAQAVDISAKAIAALNEEGPADRLLTVECNVADDAAQAAAFAQHMQRWGRMDVALLCAGISESGVRHSHSACLCSARCQVCMLESRVDSWAHRWHLHGGNPQDGLHAVQPLS